ncbi:unnamed protein product (macronuclear) [Paramecium tetraurelia]|uniref:Ubiquitin-like protease family profile domain-containing protein n=1 Tax=Paramecium tetraurelia TaxID=5888 RepID=A0DR37_PARTE|nr:uncharacterized protein GSPATT00002905001 [Paramecium tetraurelia]CAK85504.1 unnamed protein product [Paramecium tetraurelia]|eukprot:XP_001452901.1 hypothetical protein (macronuclear) [Paramecium tetraurelia strain d4-2]
MYILMTPTMQKLNSLLDSYKAYRVKSEQELGERYNLFQQAINEKHSEQLFLLNSKYNGLYEKICRECKQSNKTFKISFLIKDQDFKLFIYINEYDAPRTIEFQPLNSLRKITKTIYKVVHIENQFDLPKVNLPKDEQNKQGNFDYFGESLLLLPNQNILKGRFSETGIPIQIPTKVIYNGNNCFELNFAIEKYIPNINTLMMQSQYKGEINDRLAPVGEGTFSNPNYKISAVFRDGFYQGQVKIVTLPENTIKCVTRDNEKTVLPICYQADNSIDYYVFQTIFEGRWINQKVIDYYLYYASSEIIRLHECDNIGDSKYQNYVINSCDSADIFSSDIFEQQYYSKEFWMSYQKKYNIDINNNKNRYIFALNIGRSHFVVLVLEQNQKEEGTIYLLDSIPNHFTEHQQEVAIKNINDLFPRIKITDKRKLNRIKDIEQQRNGYDCGIHCIYNSLLVLKEWKKDMNQIDFEIRKEEIKKEALEIKVDQKKNDDYKDKKKISKLRRHIYFTMVNNQAHWLHY